MLSSFLVQHTLDQVGMATDLSHSQQKGQQMMSFHTSIIWTWRESSLVKRSQAEPSQVESSRQVKLLVTSYTQTAYLRGLNQSWNVSLRFILIYILLWQERILFCSWLLIFNYILKMIARSFSFKLRQRSDVIVRPPYYCLWCKYITCYVRWQVTVLLAISRFGNFNG